MISRFAVSALAVLAFAVPASAQSNGGATRTGHSPQLGKPASQTTGASAAAIRKASGGGVPHGPRAGSGKVVKTAKVKATASRPATR